MFFYPISDVFSEFLDRFLVIIEIIDLKRMAIDESKKPLAN